MSFSAVNGVQAILVRRTIFAAALWKSGHEFAILSPSVEELGMSPLEVHASTARTRGIAVSGVSFIWHGGLSLLAIGAYEQIPSVPVLCCEN